ncbi:hypothetical protein BJX61DRAFT_68974 [Aspergillus egyptiacus]|nr:hypothetical protein BJX61DRAFT_68974 [Aspergillus egyptiacus]
MTGYWQQGVPFVGPQWTQNNQPCVSSSTLRDFISAFPKPRLSGRITKPSSAGNSPSAGRRRTTTMSHSHQLPKQGHRTSVAAALLPTAIQHGRQPRPISWHPASTEPDYSTQTYSYPSSMTMDSHSVSDMQDYQPLQAVTGNLVDTSMLQSYTSPEMPISHQNVPPPMAASHLPMQESDFLQLDTAQLNGVSWDESASGYASYVPTASSNEWPFDMFSMNQSVPSVGIAGSNYGSVSSPGRLTEPATPDFLPIQQFNDTAPQSLSTPEKPDPEDELVGMGLYNNPDTFIEGSLYPLNGKGLKLEETFTPSLDEEEDEEEEEDPEQSDVLGHTETASPPQKQSDSHFKPNRPAASMMQRSFFFEDDDDFQQRAYSGSQRALNFGPTSCMTTNYGYGWI